MRTAKFVFAALLPWLLGAADPYADAVVAHTTGSGGGFNEAALPGVVLGPPNGTGLFQGSLDTFTLGFGGSIVLRFVDNLIVDGPGVDLTVFENAFLEIGAGGITQPPFAEPARVSVSQDGVDWHPFACDLVETAGPYWPGCAGIYPVLSSGEVPDPTIPSSVPIEDLVGLHFLSVPIPAGSGGDSFDLADVGLAWAAFVRIEAAGFATGPAGPDNAAFDLDAVVAVHSAASGLAVPMLSPAALALLSALLGGAAFAALGGGRKA